MRKRDETKNEGARPRDGTFVTLTRDSFFAPALAVRFAGDFREAGAAFVLPNAPEKINFPTPKGHDAYAP